MTNLQRLWMTWPASGYAMPVAVDIDQYKALGYGSLNKRSFAATWQSLALKWSSIKKNDKKADIATLYLPSELCFRESAVTGLFPQAKTELEFLAARLDNEDWVVLNCMRTVRSIDIPSSDLEMIEDVGSPPRIWRMHWINVVDHRALEQDVLCVPLSSDPSSYRQLLVTDLFVDRVHRLGLRGLDFKHVGYIVADASLAVPKPPAPPPPAARASKRKPPQLSSVPLPAGEQIELAEVCAKWRQRLHLSDGMAPEAVLQRITEEMRKLRLVFSTVSPEERIDIVLGLSAVYGELLHSACGWSWADVREGRSKRSIAMLAPSGAHALALMPYLQQQIQSESPTVTLLFNMIAAGQLPPAEPRQLVLVA